MSKAFIAMMFAIKYARRNVRRYGHGVGGSHAALLTKHRNEIKYAFTFQAAFMWSTVGSEFL